MDGHCNNTIGSYNCSCNGGYDGNGFNCTGDYYFEKFYQKDLLTISKDKHNDDLPDIIVEVISSGLVELNILNSNRNYDIFTLPKCY